MEIWSRLFMDHKWMPAPGQWTYYSSLANVSNKILMETTDWKYEWNHLKWFASLSTLVPRVHGLTFSNITSMDRLSINKLHLSLHLTRVVNACFLFWKKTCSVYFLCMSFSLHKLFILSLQTKIRFEICKENIEILVTLQNFSQVLPESSSLRYQ